MGDCRADNGGEIRFTCVSIEHMEEAIAGHCRYVEWLIDPYARADRFIKLLSNYVHRDAQGSQVRHKIRVRVGDDEFVEMSDSGIAQTAYSPAVFRKLMGEPAVLAFKPSARPIPPPEQKRYGDKRGN